MVSIRATKQALKEALLEKTTTKTTKNDELTSELSKELPATPRRVDKSTKVTESPPLHKKSMLTIK